MPHTLNSDYFFLNGHVNVYDEGFLPGKFIDLPIELSFSEVTFLPWA